MKAASAKLATGWITAQLIDASTAVHVWAERYDRELEDILAVQDAITNAIVATIEPAISAAERDRGRRKPPEGIGDLVAAHAYFRPFGARDRAYGKGDFKDQAVIAIDNARLFKAERHAPVN